MGFREDTKTSRAAIESVLFSTSLREPADSICKEDWPSPGRCFYIHFYHKDKIIFETKLKNNKDMILVIGMAVLVWFLWGAAFDPEEKKGRVEKAISHPGRWSKKVMRGWIEDAKEVISDPDSTDEDREKAMKDIEFFSKYIGEEELMNLRKRERA